MAEPMSAERLAEIQVALDAEHLTDGPWEPYYEGCECGGDYGCGHGQFVAGVHTPVAEEWIANGARKRGEEIPYYAYVRTELAAFTSDDLDFIIEARTAVPELLAEVKRLSAVIDRICEHSFPPPDETADEPEPGDCARCGMTYAEYDARMGERMAEALEGGAR